MASPSTPVHPARYLSIFLALLIGVYLLVFLTGDRKPEPKLGIDLQGGTRVTLTARKHPGPAHPTRWAPNPLPICASMPAIRCFGVPLVTKPSPWPPPGMFPSSFQSDMRPATGAMSWPTSRSKTRTLPTT